MQGKDCWHVLSVDTACRVIQITNCKKKLKEFAKIPVDKYMKNLFLIKAVLGLRYQSDVTFEELDMMFGGGSLCMKAKELMDLVINKSHMMVHSVVIVIVYIYFIMYPLYTSG